MRTLLIPTDFQLQSLNCIDKLIKKFPAQKLEIMMVHMLGITDSPQELQMLARRSAEYRHIPDEFYTACLNLKKQHQENIANIRIEFFYGNTMVAFKNYLKANGVELIVDLVDYCHAQITEKSLDHKRFIHRSGWEIIPVSAAAPVVVQEPAMAVAKVEELEEETV